MNMMKGKKKEQKKSSGHKSGGSSGGNTSGEAVTKLLEKLDTILVSDEEEESESHSSGGKNTPKDIPKMGPYKEWIFLPDIKVKGALKADGEAINGPVDDLTNQMETVHNVASGLAISSYPKGQGEPICDFFMLELFERRSLVCLADGCSWGEAPRQAARKAAHAYMEYLKQNLESITDIREAGRLILRAFYKAHTKIVEGYTEVWDAGTTTLCGGIMLELDEKDAEMLAKLRGMTTHNTTHRKLFDTSSFQQLYRLYDSDYCSLNITIHNNCTSPPSSSPSSSLSSSNHKNGSPNVQRKSANISPSQSTSASSSSSSSSNKEKKKETTRSKSRANSKNLAELQMLQQRQANDPRWVFVCASVGDCKAFHYDNKTGLFTDITEGNRTNLTDAKDPGGRLGPQVQPEGGPDLRNLALYFIPCRDQDIIFLVSDGVHDNLDPQNLGITPGHLGLKYSTWEEAEKQDLRLADETKNQFRIQYLNDIIKKAKRKGSPLTPAQLAAQVTYHAYALTQSSRQFIENNSHARLPEDYTLYPGKMDHTSCVAIFAGGLTLEGASLEDSEEPSESSSTENLLTQDTFYQAIPLTTFLDSASSASSASSTASYSTSPSAVAFHNNYSNSISDTAYSKIPVHSPRGEKSRQQQAQQQQQLPRLKAIRCYNMDQEPLAEIHAVPSDTIHNIIAKIKDELEEVIEGRPFRLRKGDEDWVRKPVPILKKQFDKKAYDFFIFEKDIIVIQFHPLNNSS
ncbi:TipA [Balamuthia mandrillaris]